MDQNNGGSHLSERLSCEHTKLTNFCFLFLTDFQNNLYPQIVSIEDSATKHFKMCSVVDGAFMEEVESIGNLEDKVCQKCKVAKPILTIKQKDVYCKMCFLHNCNHRFRSTLGKNKAIR